MFRKNEKKKKRMVGFKSVKLFCQIHVGEIFLSKLLNLKCGVGNKMYCIPTDI